MSSDLSKLVETRTQIELRSLPDAIVSRYPVAEYVSWFDLEDTYGNYGVVPANAAGICEAIRREHGHAALASFHRLTLLRLISGHHDRPMIRRYPPDVYDCFLKYVLAIVARMERSPDAFYDHGNDQFAKDFAVCRNKLIPCGAQLVDVNSGVPRRVAAAQGIVGCASFIGFMSVRVGGFRPFFELHMDPRLVLEFTPEGWRRSYIRIAHLLERSGQVLGVMGASWWFDPALRAVSPRLSFLQDLPRSGGARLFPIGSNAASVENALANSRERKLAYESGRYRPMNWMLVWPRKALIAWAAAHES